MESPILRAFLVLLSGLCFNPVLPAQESPTFWDSRPEEELIEAMVTAMTQEELLGQVLMLGYPEQELSREIRGWIKRRNLGGIKVFSRNVDTLPALAERIGKMQLLAAQNPFQIPLFVATDQEGGWVRHIKGQTSRTPGNLALGAGGLPRDALLTGYYIGQELRNLGINMNFAPVIDLYTNPAANVIGPRAFSSNPRNTALLALAYFQGLSRCGIISTAKHFPGHGHADEDSHGVLPMVNLSLEELWERELIPYRILIREGLPAIMSGHLAFPELVGQPTPASRSPYIMKELLREKLGFKGLAITDDMEMNGANYGGLSTAEASLEALKAGNDVVLISHTPRIQEQTWQALIGQLRKDPSFKAQIERSVRRVLRIKLKAFKGPEAPLLYPDPQAVANRLPAPGSQDFFAETSLRSVTLLRGKGIPYRPGKDERLLLIGQFEEFLLEGKRRYPTADTFGFSYSPFYFARNEQRRSILSRAVRYDTIIFCLANYNSLEILHSLQALGKRIIVISTLTPVYLRETPWVDSCLAVYGTDRRSFQAGFAALAGDFEAEGRLPIAFPGLSEPELAGAPKPGPQVLEPHPDLLP